MNRLNHRPPTEKPADMGFVIFLATFLLIALMGILYSAGQADRHTPPPLDDTVEHALATCVPRNTYVSDAGSIYTNVNGVHLCLWKEGITVTVSTPVALIRSR